MYFRDLTDVNLLNTDQQVLSRKYLAAVDSIYEWKSLINSVLPVRVRHNKLCEILNK